MPIWSGYALMSGARDWTGDHDLWWRDLRIAVAARDADRIVAVLTEHLPLDGLQLAGDAELVVALAAATGDASPGPLVSLPVELEDLAEVIDGSPVEGEGYLDRLTGEVWPAALVAYDADGLDGEIDFNDRGRWLVIVPEGSRAGYDDMTSFIATLADNDLVERLERAIHGRGAFGRYRDTLSAAPAEFTRWHRFSADRQRGRARAWLADHGYQPAALPSRTAGVQHARGGHPARCRAPACGPGSGEQPPGRLSTAGGAWPYGRWQSKRRMW